MCQHLSTQEGGWSNKQSSSHPLSQYWKEPFFLTTPRYIGKAKWTLEPFLLRELAPEIWPITGKTPDLGNRHHSWDMVTMCKFGEKFDVVRLGVSPQAKHWTSSRAIDILKQMIPGHPQARRLLETDRFIYSPSPQFSTQAVYTQGSEQPGREESTARDSL